MSPDKFPLCTPGDASSSLSTINRPFGSSELASLPDVMLATSTRPDRRFFLPFAALLLATLLFTTLRFAVLAGDFTFFALAFFLTTFFFAMEFGPFPSGYSCPFIASHFIGCFPSPCWPALSKKCHETKSVLSKVPEPCLSSNKHAGQRHSTAVLVS